MDGLKKLFRKKKKTPDHALQDLVRGLQSAWAENLRSVIVFGSFASGDVLEGTSTMNVLVLAQTLAAEALSQIAAPLQAWLDNGHAVPVFMKPAELRDMARVLPIEFLDIVDHHRVVFGESPFTAFTPDTAHLRTQIEHDLTVHLVRLRRAYPSVSGQEATANALLAESLPSVWTLCRALLRLRGLKTPVAKADAARQISIDAHLDPALIDRLEEFRKTRENPAGESLFPAYLELVEKLLHYAQSGEYIKEKL